MKEQFSMSERRGLALLRPKHKRIYSVGISTAGAAEIKMAQMEPRRLVVATTVDLQGLRDARKSIKDAGFEDRITAKEEDVSKKLDYEDGEFDFVYARLVFHYLPRESLIVALNNINQILAPGGMLYAVVRSDKTPDATRDTSSKPDPETGLTTFISKPNPDVPEKIQQRYFHSKDSLAGYIERAGLNVNSATEYEETLFDDFLRTVPVTHADTLAEVVATK